MELAEPIARKYSFKIGIGNRKGQRFGEFVEWIKDAGGEWAGVCFGIGDNCALCDDPIERPDIPAPISVIVHIKDMASGGHPGRFPPSEVLLGEAITDLAEVAGAIRAPPSDIIFGRELNTRGPSKIPVFTERYGVTIDDPCGPLPGRNREHVPDVVRGNGSKKWPYTSQASPAEQLKAEDDNNPACEVFAKKRLKLSIRGLNPVSARGAPSGAAGPISAARPVVAAASPQPSTSPS